LSTVLGSGKSQIEVQYVSWILFSHEFERQLILINFAPCTKRNWGTVLKYYDHDIELSVQAELLQFKELMDGKVSVSLRHTLSVD
jgi:hypothetical protein